MCEELRKAVSSLLSNSFAAPAAYSQKSEIRAFSSMYPTARRCSRTKIYSSNSQTNPKWLSSGQDLQDLSK